MQDRADARRADSDHAPPRPARRTEADPPSRGVANANAGTRQRAVQRLQQTGGNRATSEWLKRNGAAVQRSESSAVQRFSTQENAQLEDAGLLIAKAVGQAGQANTALSAYAAAAPRLLRELRDNFDSGLKLYQQGQEKVNYIINEAKEIAAVQAEVFAKIIDVVSAGLLDKVSLVVHDMEGLESYTLQKLRTDLKAGSLDGNDLMAGFTDALSKAGDTPAGPPGSELPAAGNELAFEKSFTALQGKAMEFLPVANLSAGLGQAIGRIDEAVRNARGLGQTRKDQPVSSITTAAHFAVDLSAKLASAAPQITKATKDLEASVATAKITAPADVRAAEKELWINWVASLDRSNYKAVDLDTIENYLKRIGVWEQLGIEPGGWFSDKEQAMAVLSAKAQTLVNANRGTSVQLQMSGGVATPITLDGLPGSPKLQVRLTPDSHNPGGDHATLDGVVVGSTAIKPADTDVLSKVDEGRMKSAGAEYLLNHGYVAVLVKVSKPH